MLPALLGAFFLTVGLLVQLWATPHLKRTPLDIDSTTLLAGSAKLFDGASVKTFPVKATSITKTDADRSTDDVVVFHDGFCLVKNVGTIGQCVSAKDPQGRLVSAGQSIYAADRVSAKGVNDPAFVRNGLTARTGLLNKWPFDAKKKAYPVWDDQLGTTTPAKYTGTEDVRGLKTYRYTLSVKDVKSEVLEKTPGLYSTQKTYWVDPVSGSIVKVDQSETRTTLDGQLLADIKIQQTPDSVATAVGDAKADKRNLTMLRFLPVIAYIGAGAMAVMALGLWLRRRTPADPGAHVATSTESVDPTLVALDRSGHPV
ncbi:hypothetical protein VV02_24285 [Luteipulveratus mongoliensis]|uniref:DUF3068 domain-containing protein n=1 Tax=Luteipulveratus mongoliensis TaxID=571913 RepID=A0A0K1JNG9_9MICO|nr:hypothetical protein VV02_24285 [Luteipulveratus mongoliensis]